MAVILTLHKTVKQQQQTSKFGGIFAFPMFIVSSEKAPVGSCLFVTTLVAVYINLSHKRPAPVTNRLFKSFGCPVCYIVLTVQLNIDHSCLRL